MRNFKVDTDIDMVNETNEETIILLAKEGHRRAFRELYEAHKQKVFRVAYRYTLNQEDAEDILQESFIKAFKKIDTFNYYHSVSFSAWILRIAVNTTIEYLRKNKRRNKDREESLDERDFDLKAKEASPESSVEIEHTLQKIGEELKGLSPRQRVIFDLRHIQHQTIKEIASQLECSESSVKKHLFRAISKLKEKLELC